MYKLNKQDKVLLDRCRGKYSSELKWYALMTQCGREHRIREAVMRDLAPHGVSEAILPELPGSSGQLSGPRRENLLFPCYLFIRCIMSDPIYEQVASLVGVVQVLGLPRVSC